MTAPAPAPDRLATRILAGLALGVLGGLLLRGLSGALPTAAQPIAWLAREILDPVGQVFLRLLFFVVVPIVFGSLALGVLQLRNLRLLGPLAGRTFALFFLNMAAGVALGLVLMNLLAPGAQIDDALRSQLLANQGQNVATLNARAAAQDPLSLARLVDMFMPHNLLQAVTDFQVLPLILFALLVGGAATSLPVARREQIENLLQSLVDIMTAIVHAAMRLAPYAVAALVAQVVILSGFQILRALSLFAAGVLVAMALHLFGTLPLMLRLLSRRRPIPFFRTVSGVLITAFSTSSSSATLPISLQVSRDSLGVSPGTAGFVLPLGATLNMSGTALYEGCVVLFVAQVYGIPLLLPQQLELVLLAVLSAVAVAGIPGASLPLIVGLLATFGLPVEGIALILGFDRLLDMARTTLNVAADLVTACIVDDAIPRPPPGS